MCVYSKKHVKYHKGFDDSGGGCGGGLMNLKKLFW
jgi:hypothetical protein